MGRMLWAETRVPCSWGLVVSRPECSLLVSLGWAAYNIHIRQTLLLSDLKNKLNIHVFTYDTTEELLA